MAPRKTPSHLVALMRSFGIGAEREYVIENLSVLLNSGMDLSASLHAVADDVKSARLRKYILQIAEEIEDGEAIARAMERAGVFSEQTVALARIGEETGRLVDNLRVVASQQQKDRLFRSKLFSALSYPALIFVVSVAIGLWVMFSLLPQLAGTFTSLHVELPLVTRIMVAVGAYMRVHGVVAFPVILISIITLFMVCFVLPKTRVIGQWMLLAMPGVGRMLRDAETGRMGYLIGSLLGAGVDLTDALRSVARAAHFARYRVFYLRVADHIEAGNTFAHAFATIRRSRHVLPIPMQQLIVAAERSGSVPQAFASIGEFYQYKSDIAAKNITVILEPVMLVAVGAGVLFLALSVVLPIYSLIGGIG